MTIEIAIDGSRPLAIRTGMRVDFSTPLYKKGEVAENRIEITEQLSIHPKDIFSFLKKNIGDSVQKGELLAQKKTLFHTKSVIADIEGIITEIDHIDGVILIESAEKKSHETCWFCGEVEAITKSHITLKIGKHFSLEAKHISDDCGGELWNFRDTSASMPETPIAFADAMSAYDIAKLDALGISGIITTQKVETPTLFPVIELKDKHGIEEIQKKNLPYCVTQAQHSTIIFYSSP